MNREEVELAAKLNRMTPKELARYLTSIIGQQTDRIEALTADNERLREALIAEREENLWNAYYTGSERDGRWTHMFMSDGEALAQACGFDPTASDYPADAIKAAIPKAARAALEAKPWTTI